MSFYFKRHLSWSLSPLGSVCNGCLLRLIPKYHPGGSHHLMPTWKSSASSICNLPLSWLIPSFPSSIYSTGFLEKACISSVQFSSVAQSCPTLCDPMNHSMPDLPVHHQLLEFTQTHVHQSVMPSSHLILCLPFSSCPQSLPASGSFPMSQLFA